MCACCIVHFHSIDSMKYCRFCISSEARNRSSILGYLWHIHHESYWIPTNAYKPSNLNCRVSHSERHLYECPCLSIFHNIAPYSILFNDWSRTHTINITRENINHYYTVDRCGRLNTGQCLRQHSYFNIVKERPQHDNRYHIVCFTHPLRIYFDISSDLATVLPRTTAIF